MYYTFHPKIQNYFSQCPTWG